MERIQTSLVHAIRARYGVEMVPELTRPDEQFGDFTTNAALQLAGTIGKAPREVAEHLVQAIAGELVDTVADVTIAGPGFINFTLHDHVLIAAAATATETMPDTYADTVVVAEYGDPNPFKILHAGHLYTALVGDAVANILERAGANVHRVNFGGDVGLHVGKCMWAIVQVLKGERPEKLHAIKPEDRANWLTERYVEGTSAYEDKTASPAKAQIEEYNKRIYRIHEQNDHESPLAIIYWTCRQWSYDYFDSFYGRVGSHFEKYYPESQTAPLGLQIVREQVKKGVYQKSDGAIVFKGESHGLHTRVFITSGGLPTYEAKDVGLIMAKWQDYAFDRSLIITANDQAEYMKVVLKSIEQFEPELAARSVHVTHGIVKLAGGVKMSSRRGNILRAEDILDAASEAAHKATGGPNEDTALAAVKYAFIRQRIGSDIIYDPEESVSLEGNSGPYLQYAHARACSILQKTTGADGDVSQELEADERTLARKLSEYPDVIQKAVDELMPHHISAYLYELAQTFNRFYEYNRVVGSDRQPSRQLLVQLYADVLKDGLELLNISAPVRL